MGQKTACITLFITTFVSWLIQKKSGKTPLETIPLYINLAGGHVNEAEMPVAIINRKNIADWPIHPFKHLIVLNVTNRLTMDGNINNFYIHARIRDPL
jgi:hypothetical protein